MFSLSAKFVTEDTAPNVGKAIISVLHGVLPSLPAFRDAFGARAKEAGRRAMTKLLREEVRVAPRFGEASRPGTVRAGALGSSRRA
jgi:hypothetical protein